MVCIGFDHELIIPRDTALGLILTGTLCGWMQMPRLESPIGPNLPLFTSCMIIRTFGAAVQSVTHIEQGHGGI